MNFLNIRDPELCLLTITNAHIYELVSVSDHVVNLNYLSNALSQLIYTYIYIYYIQGVSVEGFFK